MLIPSIINNQQYYEFDEEHLLEILPLVEEALRYLGSPDAASDWLLSRLLPSAWYNIIAVSAATLHMCVNRSIDRDGQDT